MPVTLSQNEIRARAARFAEAYKDAMREEEDAQSFQNDFFQVLGIARRRVATFEKKVRCLDGSNGYIDLFWKAHILIEMKSLGKDREKAYQQAKRYTDTLKPHELPRAILICDFQHWDFYDLDKGAEKISFTLSELPEHIHLFYYLAGYEKREYVEEDPVNVQAAELLGRFHDALKESGYSGHALEVYLVRLLFCLFAEDTGIFERNSFHDYLSTCTAEDGRDLAPLLAEFFQVLNTPEEKRMKGRNELLLKFPYINGRLFAEFLPMPAFNTHMRQALLDCCALNWGKISPAIFGSMFQSVMKPEERRALGAYYTSERNILKLINPLFMDGLKKEFAAIQADQSSRKASRLKEFHRKLGNLCFLDPACGCGNFLVVAYRELRMLELQAIREMEGMGEHSQWLLSVNDMCLVNVNQFYGIEIEEFPAQIAQVALWLMDHQMNIQVGRHFGKPYARIPLKASASIVCGNALRLDWEEVVPKKKLNYILGNPPFAGSRKMSAEQKQEIRSIFSGNPLSGTLDYVSAWYKKAMDFIQGSPIEVAFVSTNSICQGEHINALWAQLLQEGCHINFAHKTFKWSNEAKGNAAVFCVIVGFAAQQRKQKMLWEYRDVRGEPVRKIVESINPTLESGINLVVKKEPEALCGQKEIRFGNMPRDGGHLILTPEERQELLCRDPLAAPFVRPYFGGKEFLHHVPASSEALRYCIWLKDVPLAEMIKHSLLMERVQACREERLKSKAVSTREFANVPHLFCQVAQNGNEDFVAFPAVTSERREYVPLGFMKKGTIASNKLYIILNATLYDFAILSSRMHMAWMKAVCGRLEMRYSYARDLCYNTFYWPEGITRERRESISQLAQRILNIRAENKDCNLATLYNPETMPYELLKAHRKLDSAVEKAYRKEPFSDDADRVAFLFRKYEELTSTKNPEKT